MRNEKDIRADVEEKVYVYMNRGDIENACRLRGIKVTRNRAKMEGELIEAMVKEIMDRK